MPPVSTAMSSSMALRRSPKPGRLDSGDFERAAQLVDHKRGQRLAFDFFGDDEQALAHLRDFFEQRQQVFHGADFLVVDQDQRLFEQALHGLGIGDEIGREIAAVELHAFDDFKGGVDALGLFDGDDAVFADLFHGVGNKVADGRGRCSPKSRRPGRSLFCRQPAWNPF